MPTLNKVMLIGRLGRDPELRYTQSGKPVANFSIATDESYTGRDGNRVDKAEWHNIVVWDRAGENAANMLRKGSLVYIEGRLQTRKWQDQQGNNRYSTEIICERWQFLEPKGSQGSYDGPPMHDDQDFPAPPGGGGYQGGGQGGGQGGQGGYQGGGGHQGGGGQRGQRPQQGGGQRHQQPQQGGQQEEDLGPAFPSEASGMDEVPF